MNDRELICFKVSDEDMKIQEEVIIPFWEKRSMRKKILEAMKPEWKDCYEAGIFTEFMEQRGPGHTVGSRKIYEKGFLYHKLGLASAEAVVLLVIILIMTLIQFKLQDKWVHYE